MPPLVEAGDVRCAFYLPRKKRTCNMLARAPSAFCFSHDAGDEPEPSHKGFVRPTNICPHCTSRVIRLTRHVKICPAALRLTALEASSFYSLNINLPIGARLIAADEGKCLKAEFVPERDLLLDLYVRHGGSVVLASEVAFTPPETDDIRERYCVSRSDVRFEERHFEQNARLVGCLLSVASDDNLSSSPVVIELGAGRAYTSLLLTQVLAARNLLPSAVLAVDNSSPRGKKDYLFRELGQGWKGQPLFSRLRCDLADLNISGIESVASASAENGVLFVGKHVCGAALDMSLLAMTRFARELDASGAPGGGNVHFALASCCRHRCEWQKTVSATSVWDGSWGVTEESFGMLMRMAAWGPGGTDCVEDVEIGRKVMQLVDEARVSWLESSGWNAKLVQYCEHSLSPENFAIVASWRG